MVSDRAFSARNIAVLREAQGALNVAFGAILSAYVGVSLNHMESQPFDHHTLARFFLGVAGFILCLCVGNSVILRGEVRLGVLFLLLAQARPISGCARRGISVSRRPSCASCRPAGSSPCWAATPS